MTSMEPLCCSGTIRTCATLRKCCSNGTRYILSLQPACTASGSRFPDGTTYRKGKGKPSFLTIRNVTRWIPADPIVSGTDRKIRIGDPFDLRYVRLAPVSSVAGSVYGRNQAVPAQTVRNRDPPPC